MSQWSSYLNTTSVASCIYIELHWSKGDSVFIPLLFCLLRENTKICLSLCNKAWISTCIYNHRRVSTEECRKYQQIISSCPCTLQYIHTMLLLIYSMKNKNWVDMIVPIFNRSTCWLFNWKDYGLKVNVWDIGENWDARLVVE